AIAVGIDGVRRDAAGRVGNPFGIVVAVIGVGRAACGRINDVVQFSPAVVSHRPAAAGDRLQPGQVPAGVIVQLESAGLGFGPGVVAVLNKTALDAAGGQIFSAAVLICVKEEGTIPLDDRNSLS